MWHCAENIVSLFRNFFWYYLQFVFGDFLVNGNDIKKQLVFVKSCFF